MLEDFRLTSKFRDSSRSVKVKLDDHFDDNDAVELNGALSGKMNLFNCCLLKKSYKLNCSK